MNIDALIAAAKEIAAEKKIVFITDEAMTIESVPDHRCLGLPDEAYSSYCKVCWYPVYTLWCSKETHHGKCPHGCKQAHECDDAKRRAKVRKIHQPERK